MSRYRIRTFEPGDEEAFLRLHDRAFAVERSPRHWAWLYRDNPLRRTQLAGAFTEDGRCVAAHCGLTLPFWIDGRETLAMLHGDVAVDPGLRGSLDTGRLSNAVSTLFFDTYCGGPVELVWGFPEPGLRRLLTRFLRLRVLCDLAFLVHELRGARREPPEVDVDVERVERLGADVDGLWRSCRDALGAAVIRNAAYLDWRYRAHPTIDYHLLAARDGRSGGLRGLAVVREGGWDPSVLSICDWLVSTDDRDAEHALVDAALADAERLGRRAVVCWLPTTALMFHRLQIDHGFYVHGTPYQQVVRSWRGVTREWLHQHWFRTFGDMDFF